MYGGSKETETFLLYNMKTLKKYSHCIWIKETRPKIDIAVLFKNKIVRDTLMKTIILRKL